MSCLVMDNPSEQAMKAAPQTARLAMIAGGRFLSAAGIESPRLDAELLLRHVLGMNQAELYLRAG